MLLQVLSIFDSAAAAYMRPWMAQTVGEALRAFGDLACNAEHPIGQHPDDYTLMKVGTFDVMSGILEPCAPTSLGNALEFRAARQGVKLEGTHDA